MTHTTDSSPATTTRIRRRWARFALALVTPAVAVPLLTATPAHAVADCTTDCVAVTVKPGIDRFTFDVKTSTSAKIAGRISSKDGVTTVATTATGGLTTATSLSVSNLKQGTAFRYDVYGTDASGNTWRETGYFSTLVRDVAVHFNQVQITDDSDSGGAGELVGAVQILNEAGNACAVKPLAPLKMTTTTSMSSGSPVSVGSSSDLLCAGTASKVWIQGHLADDDTDAWDDCGDWWPWHFPAGSWFGLRGGNDCADWNNSSLGLTDPLPALGVASMSVPFTTKAQEDNLNDWDAGPEWTLTGSALFSHHLPALTLPATTGGAVKLPLSVSPKRGGFTVSWTPQSVPATTIYTYLVQWRRPGTATWSNQVVNAPGTSASITGLEGGVGYEIQVLAGDSAGVKQLRSTSYVTTQQLTDPTTLTGWTAGSETGSPGSTVAFTATVSGDPRPVHLQTRRQGESTWTTHASLMTSAGDTVSGSYPVLPGIHEWRLYAPQSGYSQEATSGVRTVSALSSIAGFATTKVSAPAGTMVKDRITVTPGAGREVKVQFRKAGTTTWRTYQKVIASDTGRATVKLKAFAGSSSWRVKVAKSAYFGTAATSGSRVVRGR